MAPHDEQGDILGGPILQRPESGLFASFSEYHLVFKSVVLFVFGLSVWIACVRGLKHLKRHRELKYRKAMRRKHGIPDSDCRPFAVAYAAAKRAHLEREAEYRKKTTNYVSDHILPAVGQRTDARKDARGLRRRVPQTNHALAHHNKRQVPDSFDFANRYHPNSRHRMTAPESSFMRRSPVRRVSRIPLATNLDDNEESRKRSFEDESDVEHEIIKRTRIDGAKFIDGDGQADWYAQYTDEPCQRTSKGPEDQHPRGNQEQFQHVNSEEFKVDEAMEGIDEDEDEAAKLEAALRGKKRDRAEAGSSFGGDDDDDVRNGRGSHRRKRRTILRGRIGVLPRGQKRNREVESTESGNEGAGSETSRRPAQRGSKKKRGKQAASGDVSEKFPVDFRACNEPLCGGRKVGDEWEDDGIQYKVGDKGERLRLTLVKKARSKYHMPQDSQHPDRSAALEIYVETWMTEDQYRQAERRQDLVWQEAPKESNGSKTPDVLDSLTKNGKSLLWDSISGNLARRPFRQIIPAGASIRLNPFEQLQLQPPVGRRVASSSTIISPILSGIADGPAPLSFRGFSKWEKQDREAEAMARIRAKMEEQKKAQLPPQRTAEISTNVTAHGPTTTTKLLSVPTITLTPAPSVATDTLSDDHKGNLSILSSVTLPGASNPVESKIAAPSTATGFSSATPTLIPTAASAPAAASSSASLPPFSFAKSSQTPSATPVVTSSPTISNFFEKGAIASAPSSFTPSLSPFGATTQSHSPSIESNSKPVFSFTKPDTSCTLAPAISASAAKSKSPFFATTSTLSLPVTLGSTHSATKAESSLPSTSAPSTTLGESKLTAPLFSFSGSSSPITVASTSSAESAPKFSFGQPSALPTFTPTSIPVPGIASQLNSTHKFEHTASGVMDGNLVTDAPKKSTVPLSAFGTTATPSETVKPSSSETTSVFGSSVVPSPTMNPPGRSDASSGDTLLSMSPNSALVPTVAPTFNNTYSRAPTSSSAPAFSFGGTGLGSKSTEVSRAAPLFGGTLGGSVSLFGGGSQSSKATPTFSDSTENSKRPSVADKLSEGAKMKFAFDGSTEISKPASIFDNSAEAFSFGSTTKNKSPLGRDAEGMKPTSPLTTTLDNLKSPNSVDAFKPISGSANTGFASSLPTPTFAFAKDDGPLKASTSTSTQMKPIGAFTFGTSSSATNSTFGQPSTPVANGDSNQATLSKLPGATPNVFGFGTGGPASSTFAFDKSVAQNQKQEQ